MPQPRVIKSVELPHDPDKAREVIADLKQLAAQHKEAKVVANNYEAKIFQPLAEALAENEAKANSEPEKLKRRSAS
jgi:hypothetical protein